MPSHRQSKDRTKSYQRFGFLYAVLVHLHRLSNEGKEAGGKPELRQSECIKHNVTLQCGGRYQITSDVPGEGKRKRYICCSLIEPSGSCEKEKRGR